MTELLVAGRILAHNWRMIAIGATMLGLLIWGASGHIGLRQAKKVIVQRERTIDALKLASAQAKAEHLAAARAREATFAKIQKEHADAYETRLADARARLADFVRRQATQDHARRTDLSGPAPTPGATALPAGEALVAVSDLERCTVAVVRAEAWADWWKSVSEEPK